MNCRTANRTLPVVCGQRSLPVASEESPSPIHPLFIESHKSLPLQLCDVLALNLRNYEEVQQGLKPARTFDQNAYKIIEPLIHRGDEGFVDVMAWLTEEEKKKRPGNKS